MKMQLQNSDLRFKDFSFELPKELFVNDEYRKADEVRLMVVDANNGVVGHDMFSNLAKYFDSNDLMVFNDTGISASRLNGKTSTGEDIDICFLLKSEDDDYLWEAVVLYEQDDPVGKNFTLAGGVKGKILKYLLPFDGSYWVVKDKYKGYRGLVQIDVHAGELRSILDTHGKLMHPWYAELNKMPKYLLNPIMAKRTGGILLSEPARRITPEIMEELRKKGVKFMFPSLTMAFSWRPVKAEQRLVDYEMNYEEFEVRQEDIDILLESLLEGRRVISVGTSCVRILESLPTTPAPIKSKTNVFISPGYQFKYTDGLLTNFHNSMGTHVIMACAIGGRELVLEACNIAVKEGYRFGIHGDSMLIFGKCNKSMNL